MLSDMEAENLALVRYGGSAALELIVLAFFSDGPTSRLHRSCPCPWYILLGLQQLT